MASRKAHKALVQFLRKHSTAFLTKDLYPEVKRGNYATINSHHLKIFESILDKNRVITDTEDLKGYNKDWLNMVCGYSSIALKPKSTEEVSEILKVCLKENLAVCPQGGNTGLVGGSVPVFDEVIISMSLMNKIMEINEISGTICCQAGCVLERLDGELGKVGLMMPLDLGAKGSCQIGGNIATCAGGLRLIRYGSLAANTLGLEVVLPNGEVLSMMNHMKKDNTGYHLRQLFVGSEGTLGIITGAVIQCPPRPSSVTLAFIGLNSYEDVLKTFRLAKSRLHETLSSCEMMDTVSMQSVLRLGLSCPISPQRFYMVIETHGSHEAHDEEKMSSFLSDAMDKGFVIDGTYTTQPSTVHSLWQLRERISESLVKFSYTYKYDISLPLNHFYEVVDVTKEHLKNFDNIRVSGFGHLGDGNLHLNVERESFSRELLDAIEPWLFEWVTEHGGSISAEHGIGFKKKAYVGLGKSPAALNFMKMIKSQVDPTGIMNPYKVI